MPFEGRAIKKLSFNVVLPVSLAAGISLVLMVKHLTHGSPRSTELIPPGTVLVIRLNQRLTSRTAHIGDRFKARLAVVKGAASVHSGLWVEGECLAARKALPGRRVGGLHFPNYETVEDIHCRCEPQRSASGETRSWISIPV